jgi:hypothetical protein
MRKIIMQILTSCFLAAALVGMALPARAAEEAKPDQKEKGHKTPAVIPFHGKISAVDKTAKTITLEGKEKGRLIHITSETRIMKAGKPATFDDATVGEEVGGRYHKVSDKLEALSLRIGPRPEGTPKAKKQAKTEK